MKKIKIEKFETIIAHSWLFVRITTDNGIVGIGESTYFPAQTAAKEIADIMGHSLIGVDPMNIEYEWLKLYRCALGSMRGTASVAALSAIDQALWDIKGKALDVPVWQLLGGKARDRVRAMAVLDYGPIETVISDAKAAAEAGYTAIKVFLFQPEHHKMRYATRLSQLLEHTSAVREAVGWDIDIGIELHRNMIPGDAVALIRELEQFRPFFVEDPIAPDSIVALSEVTRKTNIPIAAGERNSTIWEFREYSEIGGIDYIRPDVGLCGGITQMKKICAIAESHHQGVISHSVPNGPVALAAHVHLGVCTPNWEVLEHRAQDRQPWTQAVNHIIPVVDGHFLPPDAPGLGLELDLEGISAILPYRHGYKLLTREDGSIAVR
jgi:galactonate dehydratase